MKGRGNQARQRMDAILATVVNEPEKAAHIGLVGVGASTIYLLHHILKDLEAKGPIPGLQLSLFEKGPELGVSMPYDPKNVETLHVVNILPEETPELLCSFEEWLKSRSDAELLQIGIHDRKQISKKGIYPRVAMNAYLRCQYDETIKSLQKLGVIVNQHKNCMIVDAVENPEKGSVKIIAANGNSYEVNKMIIAMGHIWAVDDQPEHGYFKSPWPINKVFPKNGEKYNFPVGVLGASLSAFDVVASLAERHGKFVRQDNELRYVPDPGTEKFNLVLHSSQGKLPHIRCDFQWPHVMQHRFFTKEEIEQAAKTEGGKLRIETYFQQFCKSYLVTSLRKDGLISLADELSHPDTTFAGFIDMMNAARRYHDPFIGMQLELSEAKKSISTLTPIHWKETLDDLMYTLNFHAPLLSGEDLLFYQQKVIPFLINITAFLPPASAEKLLAMYKAGKVSIARGEVRALETQSDTPGLQISRVDPVTGEQKESYRLFIDCTGQKTVHIQDFPFKSLIATGVVREATATFSSEKAALSHQARFPRQVRRNHHGYDYLPGGIEVDNSFHVVGRDGVVHRNIYDITYPHLRGQRPFSPGLEQCHDTGKLLAKDILNDFRNAARLRLAHHERTIVNSPHGFFGGRVPAVARGPQGTKVQTGSFQPFSSL